MKRIFTMLALVATFSISASAENLLPTFADDVGFVVSSVTEPTYVEQTADVVLEKEVISFQKLAVTGVVIDNVTAFALPSKPSAYIPRKFVSYIKKHNYKMRQLYGKRVKERLLYKAGRTSDHSDDIFVRPWRLKPSITNDQS